MAEQEITIVPTTWDNPLAKDLMARYLRKFGLPSDSKSEAQIVAMVYVGMDAAAVAGIKLYDNGGCDLTDLYAVPSRAGVLASYHVIKYLKALVDSGQRKWGRCYAVWGNTAIHRRIERIFGKVAATPIAVVYGYGDWGQHDEKETDAKAEGGEQVRSGADREREVSGSDSDTWH